MDNHSSSHKWNNQGYTQKQIGTNKRPESRTVLRKGRVKTIKKQNKIKISIICLHSQKKLLRLFVVIENYLRTKYVTNIQLIFLTPRVFMYVAT